MYRFLSFHIKDNKDDCAAHKKAKRALFETVPSTIAPHVLSAPSGFHTPSSLSSLSCSSSSTRSSTCPLQSDPDLQQRVTTMLQTMHPFHSPKIVLHRKNECAQVSEFILERLSVKKGICLIYCISLS